MFTFSAVSHGRERECIDFPFQKNNTKEESKLENDMEKRRLGGRHQRSGENAKHEKAF